MAAYASKGSNASMVAAMDKYDINHLTNGGITVAAPKEEKHLPVVAIVTVTSLAFLMVIFLIVSFLCYHRKHRKKNKSQKQYSKASRALERRRIGAPTSLSLTFTSLPYEEEQSSHDVISHCVVEEHEKGVKYIDDDSCIHFIDMDPVIFHYHKDLTTPLIPEEKPMVPIND